MKIIRKTYTMDYLDQKKKKCKGLKIPYTMKKSYNV